MWTVVYMASNKKTADRINEVLVKEGFLVKIREVNRACGKKHDCYEILVLESEAEEAQSILINHI
jgi:hypothetical protein